MPDIDPDLDPECDWQGTKGERTIGHIVRCKVCAARWPEIAQQPAEAAWLARQGKARLN